ncbi:amidase [Apiospora aurea]|uniref:Amidase n=1 Tax=Apiospora aurea TaxID=335848 RepID=A0ABR1PUL8_9PEZI
MASPVRSISWAMRLPHMASWKYLSSVESSAPKSFRITQDFDAVSLAKAVQLDTIRRPKTVGHCILQASCVAQQLTSCLTETMFDDAIKRESTWTIPISLKDSFDCAGVQSTMGIVSYLRHPVPKSMARCGHTLRSWCHPILQDQPSQALMSSDSHNNVFGRTLNPHKLSHRRGGEGALVALRGSILGVGTDMAGSIRIPALCNGTYGFKPSTWRIPFFGSTFCHRMGSPWPPPVAGPLTCSFDDVTLFLQAVIGSQPWNRDPTALAIPLAFRGGYFSP